MSVTSGLDPSATRAGQSGVSPFAVPAVRSFWAEGATLGGGQIATVAGAIAGTRILTGLLAPAAYGDLALALTISGLLSLVASGCISNAVSRFYAVAGERETLRCFFRASAILFGEYQVGVCGAALASLVIYRIYRGGEASAWTALGMVAIALSLITGASLLLDAMQNAARHRLVVAWHQAAGQWLRLVGAILWIHWAGATAASALCGYVAAAILVLVSQFLFFSLRLSSLAASEPAPLKTPVKLITREMRAYTNPFVTFAPISWLQQSSDRWLLALFGSHREVGLYQALNQAGYSPLLQLAALISQVVAPILFSHVGDGTDGGRIRGARRKVLQLSWLMFIGTLVFSGLLWLFGKPLFSLVAAPEYRSAARYLPLVALAGGLFATGQMLTTDSLVQMNSRALVAPKICCALLAVLLNYAGARALGLPGVVWAGVVSSSAYALWILLLTRRRSPHGPALQAAR